MKRLETKLIWEYIRRSTVLKFSLYSVYLQLLYKTVDCISLSFYYKHPLHI